ncbi:26 kDa secreted antigen [Psilocybe cubensis]|uniref:PEBP-like protein n=2 Tax=Psilocybe cubensis TaxID=181762 RepID=A0A8H7Y1Q5_PSICU|nr:26 kDa secreted antigen [Psilocybe cubensis]KAH9483787.1 26 kDa secreted antigen [Psilocybe cubensis]
MFALSFVVSVALVPFVAAQASVDIQAIEAHFTQSHVVPDLLASFNPSALLSLNFAGVGNVQPGQKFTKDQVGTAPTVTVTPANSSVVLNGTYTIAMVDADIVGTDLADGENRHWLVNGATISNSVVTTTSGTAITAYAGPGPAAGSGPHRYVVLLYAQPSTFAAPAAFANPGLGVSKMDFNAYVKDSGLGPLVGGTYITVEEGTATVSVPATSAVVTSTLSVASSTKSDTSASSSGSQSSTPTGTSNNTNGAGSIHYQLSGLAAVSSFFLAALFFNRTKKSKVLTGESLRMHVYANTLRQEKQQGGITKKQFRPLLVNAHVTKFHGPA